MQLATPPDEDKTEQISQRLLELLSGKKLYLNPNLTRKELADALNVNEVLSQPYSTRS